MGFHHELKRRRADSNDQVWPSLRIFANVPFSETLAGKPCLETKSFQDSRYRVRSGMEKSLGRRRSLIENRNSRRRNRIKVIENEDPPDCLGLLRSNRLGKEKNRKRPTSARTYGLPLLASLVRTMASIVPTSGVYIHPTSRAPLSQHQESKVTRNEGSLHLPKSPEDYTLHVHSNEEGPVAKNISLVGTPSLG